jgi:hypothetical protein
MARTFFVGLGLAFGLVSYCLILLVSQEVPILTLEVMGILSLSLTGVSMWLLWNVRAEQAPVRCHETNSDAAPLRSDQEEKIG